MENRMITRNSVASSSGRRNSVGEIADFFEAQMPSPKMSRKASGRTTREKEKEREKENKEARDSIKHYIQTGELGRNPLNSTNGGVNEGVDHDKQKVNEAEQEQTCKQSCKSSIATQTSDDEILIAIKELADKYQKLEDTIEDPKVGLSVNLAKTQGKVNELHSDIHGAVSGLVVKVQTATNMATENSAKILKIEDNQARMAALLDENKRLVHELKIMQGLVQKVAQQSSQNNHQILDLTKRGMEQNIIIHGVDNSIEVQDPRQEKPMFATVKERCKHAALKFFQDEMNLDIQIEDILKAHRTGAPKEGKVRPLIVKMTYPAKDLVMENLASLKNKSNKRTKQVYFISEQVPEGIVEMRKQTTGRAKIIKEENQKKPKSEQKNVQVINDKVLIDGQVKELDVQTPQPSQLFLNTNEQKQVDKIQLQMIETDLKTMRNSEFRAIATKVHSIEETNLAYIAVAQRYPSADHISMAYALREDGEVKSGFCDDREHGAGTRLRKLIFDSKSRNTAVFVLRKFGGIHLGFNRFEVIESIANDALYALNT